MKTKKMLGFFTAAIMAAAALPVVSVGAVDAALPGDVDQDGVITGHDSAMVSHALYEDPSTLTEEQKALADYNGDGVVDETACDENCRYCFNTYISSGRNRKTKYRPS